LFSLEPLYYQQFRASYFDTLYLFFLFSLFYFLLKEKYLISAVFLGLMAVTKNTALTFLLVGGTCSFYLLLTKKEDLTYFLKTLLVSILVIFLAYARYFMLGNSLREFLGLQKWILNFYGVGAKGTIGMVFPMIFSNRWPTWWDGIIRIAEWQISWPLLLVVSSWYLVSTILGGKLGDFFLVGFWLVFYFLFLCFIPVWPRYLLLALPFMYLAATLLFKSFYEENIAKT